VVFVLIISYYFLLKVLDTTCLFKYVFGIMCPTCGSTRALISLLKLDFHAYASYNIMALPILIAIFIAVHPKLFKQKFWKVIVIIIAIIAFAYYLTTNIF